MRFVSILRLILLSICSSSPFLVSGFMDDPVKYETSKGAPFRMVAEFVPQLIGAMSWTEKNQAILDYGCGAGSTGYHYILPRVHSTNSTLYSVDVSPNMVDYARKHYADDRIVYAHAVGDILGEFPFCAIEFDKIFSIHVFHFISDMRKGFNGLYKILKPGGQLGFTSITIKSLFFESWRILAETPKWEKYMTGYEMYLPVWSKYDGSDGEPHFRRLLEQAGFIIQDLRLLSRYYTYQMEELLDLSMSLIPTLGHFPKELHPDLKEELRGIMANLAGIPRNSTTVPYSHEYLYGVVKK